MPNPESGISPINARIQEAEERHRLAQGAIDELPRRDDGRLVVEIGTTEARQYLDLAEGHRAAEMALAALERVISGRESVLNS